MYTFCIHNVWLHKVCTGLHQFKLFRKINEYIFNSGGHYPAAWLWKLRSQKLACYFQLRKRSTPIKNIQNRNKLRFRHNWKHAVQREQRNWHRVIKQFYCVFSVGWRKNWGRFCFGMELFNSVGRMDSCRGWYLPGLHEPTTSVSWSRYKISDQISEKQQNMR